MEPSASTSSRPPPPGLRSATQRVPRARARVSQYRTLTVISTLVRATSCCCRSCCRQLERRPSLADIYSPLQTSRTAMAAHSPPTLAALRRTHLCWSCLIHRKFQDLLDQWKAWVSDQGRFLK